MSERKVKGAVVLGYSKFIKKTWGKEGLEQYVSETGVDTEKMNDGTWYDDQYSRITLSWIAKNKGPEYLERCGIYTVKDLGMLSYIVRFMDIKSILKRGPDSYDEAFNYGSFKVNIGENKAHIKIRDSGKDDEYACKTWMGVFKGMLEMTKTNGRVIETQCEYRGADECIFEMTWK